MKIIHTADWHLGQVFYDYDRVNEHAHFLNWLIETVDKMDIDVLLISGDIFDISNPAATSTKLYYNFLVEITQKVKNLQIIITAGNHDSAARLEAPKQILEAFNITVVGNIPRNAEQEIDFSKLIIPLKTRNGNQEALCMAIPFLRQGDYPILPNSTQPYSDGVSKLYEDAFNYAKKCLKPNEGIVAMGHLHTLNAVPSTDDKSERIIMGGIEFVPASAFNPDIAYTALGHIHKAQKVAQKDNIRYSGSPIPMSFSELNYKHQIIYFELDKGISKSIQGIEIPLLIPLKIIPAKPQKLTEVLAEIEKLPGQTNDFHLSPYLEIQVLIDGPEPSLKFQLERALEGKNVRLARIKTFSRQNLTKDELVKNSSESEELKNIKPLDLFYKVYQQKYDGQLPAKELVDLFNVVVSEISE